MFTDVTLAVDNETFEAHKLVLSACSPYFKHLLTSNKCRHPVIFLKDVESHHIALLLQYMYLGQIAVKREELSTFLRSADHLKIRGLAMTSPTSALPRYVFSLTKIGTFITGRAYLEGPLLEGGVFSGGRKYSRAGTDHCQIH
jgi:hypothetical protein